MFTHAALVRTSVPCKATTYQTDLATAQVLLLRAVVAQLQGELAPRLAAYHRTAGPAAAAKAAASETGKAAASRLDNLLRNRRRLLEESHLWRLLAVRCWNIFMIWAQRSPTTLQRRQSWRDWLSGRRFFASASCFTAEKTGRCSSLWGCKKYIGALHNLWADGFCVCSATTGGADQGHPQPARARWQAAVHHRRE